MKRKYFLYVSFILMFFSLTACGGKKKFNPKERTSSLSLEKRDKAIEEKRHTLLSIDIDSLIMSHGVTFSVIPLAVTENISVAASDKLASKLIQISSHNGIGGLCSNPVMALVSRVDCVDKSMTGTSPQKAIVKYELTFYCGNLVTGDIYASCTQTVTGVGANFTDATSKAFNEVKDSRKLQQMLMTASDMEIQWYSSTDNVKRLVDKAIGEQNYNLASAILSSVPEQAKATYAYAVKKNEMVTNLMFQEKADALLASMENAIAEGGDSLYNPAVGACMELIPQRSNAYAKAKKIHDAYIKKLDATKQQEHIRELKELEIRKIKAPFEAKATIEMAKESASLQKNEMWANALSSSVESIGNGMRGGKFGENGMFGKGGIFGLGSFAEPLSNAVKGIFGEE